MNPFKLPPYLLQSTQWLKKYLIISLLPCFLLIDASRPVLALSIDWPADTVQWRPSSEPGYALTLQHCTTCHSAHYAQYQPPNAGPNYWKAQVGRMQSVFKAPIDDEQAKLITQYLSQTYGTNLKN